MKEKGPLDPTFMGHLFFLWKEEMEKTTPRVKEYRKILTSQIFVHK
jgi:hypothetical protein